MEPRRLLNAPMTPFGEGQTCEATSCTDVEGVTAIVLFQDEVDRSCASKGIFGQTILSFNLGRGSGSSWLAAFGRSRTVEASLG